MKCKVNEDWLKKTDVNGYCISSWATKQSSCMVFCNICSVSIDCGKKGFQAITQHAQTMKHIQSSKAKLTPLQLKLATGPQCGNTSSVNTAHTRPKLICIGDSAIIAELKWVMKCVFSNYSFKSSDDIGDLFRSMFSTGVPEGFGVAKTKAGYYLTEALGPHFRSQLLEDLANKFYSLQYDETTNSESFKELQVIVRFWSTDENQIVCRHLESFFIGSATGEVIKQYLEEALKNADLPFSKFLMLASDGPNVNKKVFRLMNETVKEDRGKGLIDIGSCNLHVVHNAFGKAIEEFGADTADLIVIVFAFFDGWPSRWEEYEKAQDYNKVPSHRFLKHVPIRWLTLKPAAERLIEQWPALQRYFLEDIPKKNGNSVKKLMSTVQYQKIVSALKSTSRKAEVAFIIESASIFERFCLVFQKNEPLIHVLYKEVYTLTATIMGRVCKPETLLDVQSTTTFSSENLLPLASVNCGDAAENILRKTKDSVGLGFRKNVQEHFIAGARHLLEKTILVSGGVLKYFKCLAPEDVMKLESIRHIVKVARVLPLDVTESTLMDEWKLLQMDEAHLEMRNKNKDVPLRVDHYWRQIFDIKNAVGTPRYPQLERAVNAALTLLHGSADVERGFSISGKILTSNNVRMKARTLNAKLYVKEAVRKNNGRVDHVHIPETLITSARFAHSKYKKYLEEEKIHQELEKSREKGKQEEIRQREETRREQDKTRQDIETLEKQYKEAKQVEIVKKKASDKLLSEVNTRLKQALKDNKIEDVIVAQGMLEGANVLRKEIKEKEEVSSKQIKIEKRKSGLITSFLKPAPTKVPRLQ